MAAGGVEMVTKTPTVISAAVYMKTLPKRAALESMCTEELLSFDSLAGQPKAGCWEPVEFELSKHLFFAQAAYKVNARRLPLLHRSQSWHDGSEAKEGSVMLSAPAGCQ